MSYRLGLDIGITSIGWATILLDENGNKLRIGDLGVRIFDKPEDPQTGASLAAPRRDKRSMRRRIRRHKHRLTRIKNLIQEKNIMSVSDILNIYNSSKPLEDIYKIRYEALDRKLNKEEFVRLLIHIAQRRGFKSNRKADTQGKSSDEGRLLTAVSENEKLLAEKNYRTIGEMFYLDSKYESHKRNKTDEYSHTVSRQMVSEEIRTIFHNQRTHGNTYSTEELESKYLEIVNSQRNFDEGPSKPSPYYADSQIEKMLGNCTFEPEEKRAVKASFTFERFMLWTKINNLRIRKTGEPYRSLSIEQKNKIAEKAYQKNELKYSDLRQVLELDETETFKGLQYGRKNIEEVEKKSKFVKLTAYHDIRRALDKYEKGYIKKITSEQMDDIGYALTVYKNDEKVLKHLKEKNIDEKLHDYLLTLSFSKTGHLSIKAIKKILPYVEQGYDYDKACEEAGYDFRAQGSGEKSEKLPHVDYENITNPLVKRALSQCVKVVNAIIRKYGSPDAINIELSREMSKNHRERIEAINSIEENTSFNEKVKNRLIKEFGVLNPTGSDIVKLKLFEQQDGFCLYSCKKMNIRRLFETGYTDIDHIIPYSKSFDDSYNNKVLVLSAENRQKGDKTAYEYLKTKNDLQPKYVELVNSLKTLPYRKRQNLLRKEILDREIEEFRERNLNDTRYITRELSNHMKRNLKFAKTTYEKKKRVTTVNGRVTAYMRKRWGLSKVREENDLHHALDAVVIACVDDGIINRISKYHKYRKNRIINKHGIVDTETGEIFSDKFPEPWHYFRDEVNIRLGKTPDALIKELKFPYYPKDEFIKPVFVSRAPRRSSRGAAHKETIRSPKLIEEGIVVTKKFLVDLQKIKEDKETGEMEIEGYYKPETDRLLYNALKERILKNNNDPKKAFAEKFYKPKSDGSKGPEVKKVKICEKASVVVSVNDGKGVAANDSMVRIDVFEKKGKNYMVPVYVSDTLKNKLPNKIVKAHKPYSEWPEVDNRYNFRFSIYPNDLLRIKKKKPIKIKIGTKEKQYEHLWGYYKGTNISTASITIISPDGAFELGSIGIMNLDEFEKWNVSYLGEKTKIKSEKRHDYSQMKLR